MAAITQPWEHRLGGTDIAVVAQRAEQLGFAMVFLPEHFLTPTSHLELSGNHYFDATTAQAFVAGAGENDFLTGRHRLTCLSEVRQARERSLANGRSLMFAVPLTTASVMWVGPLLG